MEIMFQRGPGQWPPPFEISWATPPFAISCLEWDCRRKTQPIDVENSLSLSLCLSVEGEVSLLWSSIRFDLYVLPHQGNSVGRNPSMHLVIIMSCQTQLMHSPTTSYHICYSHANCNAIKHANRKKKNPRIWVCHFQGK